MPKSGGDKQNDKNSEHNHSDFSPRNYLHILYHSLRLDKKTYHNVWVSNVSACMGGGLANEMESHTSSERVQAGVHGT